MPAAPKKKQNPKKQKHFAVPLEMAARLQEIAAAKNHASVFDLLAEYVQAEMKNGVIPKDIPGIYIDVKADEVRISANEFCLAVQRGLAGRFADSLREIAQRRGVSEFPGARVKKAGQSGVQIETTAGETLGLNSHTAAELADLIEEKAATA